MISLLRVAALGCAMTVSTAANATPVVRLVDFDHITRAFIAPIPTYTAGLYWLNFDVVAAAYASPVGLQNAVVSTDYVAINNDPALPSAFGGGSFTFQDAYFGAAARDGLNIDVFGIDAKGVVLDSTSFTVDTLGPTFESFNWANLYAVFIISSGGTLDAAVSPLQDSTLFALDNLRYINTTPEPGSVALMIAGLGLGALALKRRRAA